MAQEKKCIQKAITYATTTATYVGQLPPNAYVVNIEILVSTAFNAGGNDYVDVGTSDSGAYFANDTNVASAGKATVTLASGGLGVQSTTAPTDVYVIYVPAGSTPTAGAANVVFTYAFDE